MSKKRGWVEFHLLRRLLLLLPPHWFARFEDLQQHPVWLEDLLDVDVCVSFSSLGFLEG